MIWGRYIHGDLHEEIYMKVPAGIHTQVPRAVCKLQKSLYGLKQASRQWYEKLTQVLYSKGYKHSSNDYSLFYKKTGESHIFLAVYVDDILVTGDNDQEIQMLKAYLDATFKIKDLGAAHYFLGMELLPVRDGLVMTQRKFTKELLSEFRDAHMTPVVCPLDSTHKLLPDQGTLLPDPAIYRRLVGKLNFLTHTRPDLAFAVQHLSQFMQQPRQPHLQAAYHVLRYLHGQPDLGILISNTAQYNLEAYCDSDWAACSHSRQSVSGYVVFFGNSLISWKSKKQGVVSLSSAEAEYRSLRRLVSELAWLSRLFHELGVSDITPIPVKCDSQAAIYIARNPVFHERTKHIELDCHFVREKLLAGLISLHHVRTQSQLADLLTKPLCRSSHYPLLSKLGVHSTSNLRGGVGGKQVSQQCNAVCKPRAEAS
uniref:Reverse transcriptase Ty1/copia-type domain-containing protein n=1 Tax=Opuntia streptacantha TaxID=393608 RepID=A0A7C9CSR4_OPUST